MSPQLSASSTLLHSIVFLRIRECYLINLTRATAPAPPFNRSELRSLSFETLTIYSK